MRKALVVSCLCLFVVTLGANAADARGRLVAVAAASQAVTTPADDWPHPAKFQQRHAIKALDDCEINPMDCVFNPDESIGTGGGSGCTWSGCKSNYSCSLMAGMCQARTYGNCKDDASQGRCSQACMAC